MSDMMSIVIVILSGKGRSGAARPRRGLTKSAVTLLVESRQSQDAQIDLCRAVKHDHDLQIRIMRLQKHSTNLTRHDCRSLEEQKAH